MKNKFGFIVITALLLFSTTVWAQGALDDLAQYVGNWKLTEQRCPAGIANSINVGIYNGIGVVTTSLGYLFSINVAGGSAIVKNGPTTICTGQITGDKFRGSCLDNNRSFCAVTYRKESQ